MLRLLALLILLASLPTLAAGASVPEIVAIYPDPVTDGDAGEFVVLDVPPGANLSRYALTDGESRVSLPAVEPGRVALAMGSSRAARLDGHRVQSLPDGLRLANDGERVRLVRDGATVDSVSYGTSTEGEVLAVAASSRRWRPLGATDRPVVAAGPARVRAFVLPDAGGLPAEELATAEERVLLAGYTLTSEPVTAALLDAHRRNVSVRVLLDADPVGGVAAAQARRLDRLDRAGVPVTVVGGARARVRFHHAKYAVIDDRVLVTTENWKPAGTGGHASRGWGVVTNQSRIVDGLAATFRADAGWADGIAWADYRDAVEVVESNASAGRFGRRFEPARVPIDGTRLLVAPDNAERGVLALLAGAEESLWIEQAGVGGTRQPFVRAAIDAARRGVSVRLLLGSAWYNREENAAVAERLRAIADREDLDLAVRLVEPRGRFARLHAKAAVIDGERVLLGSLNWNNNSARNNREVALVLRGEAVGDYYGDVIRADWRGGQPRLTIGLAVACLLAAVGAGTVARRVRFEDEGGEPVLDGGL